MSESRSPIANLPDDEYVILAGETQLSAPPPSPGSATPGNRSGSYRIGGWVAPLAAVVSMLGPVPTAPVVCTGYYRRVYSGRELTLSAAIAPMWFEDDVWTYQSAQITRQEIAALDAILALPAADGWHLPLAD